MITDIHCPQCGAPANFDIVKQKYLCSYCGSSVTIGEAQNEKKGYRKMRSEHLQTTLPEYNLVECTCSGCGAKVVFQENEALSDCAFCGRSLVRTDYVAAENMPEAVIPFQITEEEARANLQTWCEQNKSKREAQHLAPLVKELKGYYLPYEMIYGPITFDVSRINGLAKFPCSGFLKEAFVNRSKQLDNLLLDGMEPYDISKLRDFDFGFVAGHHVKTPDVDDKYLEKRLNAEVAETYTPFVRKALETKAVDIHADSSETFRLPVLLPVYYVSKGETIAAVNGQTGKVSVRAEKDSHYVFLPWWLKAILTTALSVCVVIALALYFGMNKQDIPTIAGCLGLVLLVIMFSHYSETVRYDFFVYAGRKVFTSGEQTFKREGSKLVPDEKILQRKIYPPVFLMELDAKIEQVLLRFFPLARKIKTVALLVLVAFFPVILALLINGFDFQRLDIGVSLPWFTIAAPILPLILFRIILPTLNEEPWIYKISPEGKKTRYKRPPKFKITKEHVFFALRVLYKWPVCLGFWIGVLFFCIMVWGTAFGLD